MGWWYHILRFFLAGLSPETSDARVDGRTKKMVEIYLKHKIIYDQQEEKTLTEEVALWPMQKGVVFRTAQNYDRQTSQPDLTAKSQLDR